MSDPIRKPYEFPSRSESILSDTIGLEGYSIETPPRSRIEHLLIELKEIIGQGGGGSSTAYATSLEITMDEYFVMTATLKNKDGDTLGQVQTIDLPLESVVVNGSYDSINKNVVLTLENGNTVSFSVADLVSGLQTEITSNNKLDADLVDDSTATHKFATEAQLAQIQINKTALDNKADKSTTYTKTEVDTALSSKANSADVYSKTAVDTALGNKADKSTTYTKTEVDTSLSNKADKSTTYTKTEVDTALSAKANAADVYSKTAVDTALGNKADKSTTYTKTEVDTSLSNKADKSTTYTKTEVDTALGSKQNTIDANSKLSSDLVDDTNATHKFATAEQLSQITTNENNILWNTQNGVKNIAKPNTISATSGITVVQNLGHYEISGTTGGSQYTAYLCTPTEDIIATEALYIPAAATRTNVSYMCHWKNTQDESRYSNIGTGLIVPQGCKIHAIYIQVAANTTFSLNADMMICKKAIYDADPSYQPYAMSNAELTAAIQAIQAQLSGQ